MSYHVEQTCFKELPKFIVVRKDGYMHDIKRGKPITEYVYMLQDIKKVKR